MFPMKPQLISALRLVTLAAISIACFPMDSAAGDMDQSLRMVKEAWNAAVENLRSGKGSGTYLHYVAKPGEKSMQLVSDAKVKVFFDRGHYRLELEYKKESHGTAKRTMVYDESVVIRATFSPNIMPKKANAEVFNAGGDGQPSIAGFQWNVAKLPQEIINFERVAKAFGPDSISVKQKEVGLLEGTYKIGKKTRVVFLATRDAGFNITLFRVLREGINQPIQQYLVGWKKANNVWFIESLTEESGDPEDFAILRIRRELRYEKFEPNVAVLRNLFSMETLDLPDGTRVMDHRPEAQQPFYYYRKPSDTAKVDTLLANVLAMPKGQSYVEEPQGLSLFWLAMSGVALLLTVTLLLLLYYRRRKARSTSRTPQ